jgi:hypothetical protein
MQARFSSRLFYQTQNKLFQYVVVVVVVVALEEVAVIFKDVLHDFATLTGLRCQLLQMQVYY